jgi:hypothetical protein
MIQDGNNLKERKKKEKKKEDKLKMEDEVTFSSRIIRYIEPPH